jgi:hypothetical protein
VNANADGFLAEYRIDAMETSMVVGFERNRRRIR